MAEIVLFIVKIGLFKIKITIMCFS